MTEEEFAAKSVEHQLKKDLIQFINESNQEKQKTLEEEKQNLETIRIRTYNFENNFCDSVWKFSREHNFGKFLVNYPKIKKPPICNCEFYKESVKTREKELEENAEIRKVTREVEALRLEFETLSNSKNLEDEIKKASEELRFASEDDVEIQRLNKVLQNSQKELEFMQSEIEHFQNEGGIFKNLELDSSPAIRRKNNTQKEKSSRNFKFIQITPRVKNSPFTYPNTIDNYLILKGTKLTSTEEKGSKTEDKKLDESKITTEIKNQNKCGILNSWSQIKTDNKFSFIDIENSIKDTYDFLERTKKCTVKEILSETPMKSGIKDLMAEQKPIPRAFIPKKQSTISEKLLKKTLNPKKDPDY